MLRHIISIIIQYSNFQVLTLQHNSRSAIMAWHSVSIINPPISTVALIQKHFQFLWCLFQNSMKTELK